MTDAEFDHFVAASCRKLKRKQATLTRQFSLGTHARWDYDQTAELLRFSDPERRTQLEATTIDIGSFSAKSQTWQWAWANPSIPEPARRNSLRLQELFEVTGVEVFRIESFLADEEMAWELAAMSIAHLKSAGCYRAPTDHLSVFLAIVNVRIVGAGK